MTNLPLCLFRFGVPGPARHAAGDLAGPADRGGGLPGIRSVHTRPIPRIGGVAIYVSAMCLIVSLLFLNNDIGEQFRDVRLQVVTLLGRRDRDLPGRAGGRSRGLPARVKFLAELLGAAALCLVGRADRQHRPGRGIGHLAGLAGLAPHDPVDRRRDERRQYERRTGWPGRRRRGDRLRRDRHLRHPRQHDPHRPGPDNDVMMALFALALLGSLSGFLFFNFNPAKVFMGDCGSLFLGFTIASASVMCVSKSAALVGLALPALALGIPIFDTLFSMLRRFLERRSLFAPDRSHFHHRLLELGLNQRRAVMVIYVATLLAAGLGLFMMIGDSVSSPWSCSAASCC